MPVVYRNWFTALWRTLRPYNHGNNITFSLRNGVQFCVQDMLSDVSMITEIWVDKCYEPTCDFIVQADWTVVDVGANKGVFSVRAAKANPSVQVYSLEPDPTNLAYLQRNIRGNGLTNVVTLPIALAAESGTIKLHHSSQPDAHSTLKGRNSKATGSSITVEALSLADFVTNYANSIDLLKIDIEGAELDVLRHCPLSVWNKIQRVVLEVHRTPELPRSEALMQAESLLSANGFVVGVTTDRNPLVHGIARDLTAK